MQSNSGRYQSAAATNLSMPQLAVNYQNRMN